jgi:hypothetical protein
VDFIVGKISVTSLNIPALFSYACTKIISFEVRDNECFSSIPGNCMSEFMGLIYGSYEAKVSLIQVGRK